jgi:hypothetical protein
VRPAEQDEVPERRGTTACPVRDVVRVAPVGRAVAAGGTGSPGRASRSRVGAAGERRGLPSHVEGFQRPRVITRDTPASHARRRAVSPVIGPMPASAARPARVPRRSSRRTFTTMCGRSPATVGRSQRSRNPRQTSPNASTRRCAGVLASSPDPRAHASMTDESADRRDRLVSGSRSPSILTMPPIVGDTCSVRASKRPSTSRSASTSCRQ